MKYLCVKEHNFWENEKWYYCFPIENNKCEDLNLLISACKIATEKNREIYKIAKNNAPSCIIGAVPCAVSCYYTSIIDDDKIVELKKYENTTYYEKVNIINNLISSKKLKGVFNKICNCGDKYEDLLYKGGLRDISLKKIK